MNTLLGKTTMTFALLFAVARMGAQDDQTAQPFHKGRLLYERSLSSPVEVADWVMEGPGQTEFRDGWMHMFSPNEEGHHVFWRPQDLPESFIAEWELQNLGTDAGLCIVFFAAKGVNGEDIFDPALKPRNGIFNQYTKSDLHSYHISYYANGKDNPGREISHIRKNQGFHLVQQGEPGIPLHSTNVHKIRLVKNQDRIRMYVDERKIIDWQDDGKTYGPVLGAGKIGFRQMQWTHFRYRNFKVWELDNQASTLDAAVIYPKSRIWTEPAAGETPRFNSPSLQWPAIRNGRYRIRLASARDFGAEVIEQTGIPFAIYNPHRKLAPGLWYWQYKEEKGEWSPVDSFLITASTREFLTPPVDQLIANIPVGHPRVLVTQNEWADLRQRAKTYQETANLIREADQYLRLSPPSEQEGEAEKEGATEHQNNKLALNASRDLGDEVARVLNSLIQAYILTRDQQYFVSAKKWMLEIATWDPNGVTRLNNFGDSNIMTSLALGVDTFWDLLSPPEREKIVAQAAARAHQFYLLWIGTTEARATAMHIWQHILHRMIQTSVALLGETPEAETWLTYLYELWIAQSPKMAETDGSWFNGTGYVRMNILTLLDVPAIFQEYTGVDFIWSDWYANFPQWLNYAFPPGAVQDGFANDGDRYSMPSLEYAGFSDAFARMTGNAYAAWYAKKCLEALGASLPDDEAFRWFRIRRGYRMDLPAPLKKLDLPEAAVFPDGGLVYMNTDLEHAENNLMLSIRSAPFGPLGHTHADHNTFNVAYGGRRLFYNSGYRPAMGDPHFLAWHKDTRGHNGILIDGQGQSFEDGAYAFIPRFLHGRQISYAVGDASRAYPNNLKRFRRHYLMLRPSVIVIYDELEADDPAEWSWLLHHDTGLQVDAGRHTITGENGAAAAQVSLFSSSPIDFRLSDQFSVPPENFAGKMDEEGNLVDFKDQWHFAGVSKHKTPKMRYLAVIQAQADGRFKPIVLNEVDSAYRIGDWEIRAVMDAGKPASIEVHKTDGTASFISSGPFMAKGTSYPGRSNGSAKLFEIIDGQPHFQEQEDVLPAAIDRIRNRRK